MKLNKSFLKNSALFTIFGLIIFPILLYVITQGTFDYHQPEERSNSFDSLGESLLDFRADVKPNTINWEGFDINGKKYMYFGPFPAFIRIGLNAITPKFYGMQARVSCIIALALIFISSFFIFNHFINKNKNLKNSKSLLLFFSLAVIFFGTPTLYLSTLAWIYHEAIIWSLAWAFIAISAFFIITQEKKWTPFWLSIFGISTSFTLLSKTTFALPLYFLCAYLAIRIFYEKGNKILNFIALSISAGFGGIFQCWYNYARFGNIYQLFDIENFYMQAAKTYGMFNIKRLGETLSYYVLPSTDFIQNTFPFFIAYRPNIFQNPLFHDWAEPIIPITMSCSLLVFTALFFIFKARPTKNFFLNWFPIIFFTFVEAFIVSCYVFLSERMITEYIPLIFCLMIFALCYIKSKKAISCFLIFSILSIVVTGFSTAFIATEYLTDIRGKLRQNLIDNIAFDIKSETDNNYQKQYIVFNNIVSEDFSFENARIESLPDIILKENFVKNAHNAFRLHANDEITFDVPDNAMTFEAVLNTSSQAKTCESTSVAFQLFDENKNPLTKQIVLGPQQKYFRFQDFSKFTPYPYYVNAGLHGAKKIIIKISQYNENNHCDHFSMIDPAFLLYDKKETVRLALNNVDNNLKSIN